MLLNKFKCYTNVQEVSSHLQPIHHKGICQQLDKGNYLKRNKMLTLSLMCVLTYSRCEQGLTNEPPMITFDLDRNVSQFPSTAWCFERDKEKTFSWLCVALVIAGYSISFGVFLRETYWVSLSSWLIFQCYSYCLNALDGWYTENTFRILLHALLIHH